MEQWQGASGTASPCSEFLKWAKSGRGKPPAIFTGEHSVGQAFHRYQRRSYFSISRASSHHVSNDVISMRLVGDGDSNGCYDGWLLKLRKLLFMLAAPSGGRQACMGWIMTETG